MRNFICLLLALICSCESEPTRKHLRLWYDEPAKVWTEALPLGNGRIGAMVFGGVDRERIQFNEETLWTGAPHDYANDSARFFLKEIRSLLSKGKQSDAEELAMKHFMSKPLRQKAYQPFGDVYLEFDDHDSFKNYHRELDLEEAICKVSYQIGDVYYQREALVSVPDQVFAYRVSSDKSRQLNFTVNFSSPHTTTSISTHQSGLVMNVTVQDGGTKGRSQLTIKTNGSLREENGGIRIEEADEAVIYLAAATNFQNYSTLSDELLSHVESDLQGLEDKTYDEVKKDHIDEYQELYDRFSLDLGIDPLDTIPTDTRLKNFKNENDAHLVSTYVQYGRYLLIASSRPGTKPANLQGIWNADIKPAWDSKIYGQHQYGNELLAS